MGKTKFNPLGQRIADAISAVKKTRREVAAEVLLAPDGLYRRLWGQTPWRLWELEAIASLCETTVAKLLQEDETPR